MKTVLKPFDIEKAKTGAKVVTRSGLPVKIVSFEFRNLRTTSMVAHIVGLKYDSLRFYHVQGIELGTKKDSEFDLSIKEQEQEWYVNLFEPGNPYDDEPIIDLYTNVEDAFKHARPCSRCIGTFRLEKVEPF